MSVVYPTLVQSVTVQANSSGLTATLPNTTQAGNYVVFCYSSVGAAGAQTGWTTIYRGTGSPHLQYAAYQLVTTAGAAQSVTFSTNSGVVTMMEWTNVTNFQNTATGYSMNTGGVIYPSIPNIYRSGGNPMVVVIMSACQNPGTAWSETQTTGNSGVTYSTLTNILPDNVNNNERGLYITYTNNPQTVAPAGSSPYGITVSLAGANLNGSSAIIGLYSQPIYTVAPTAQVTSNLSIGVNTNLAHFASKVSSTTASLIHETALYARDVTSATSKIVHQVAASYAASLSVLGARLKEVAVAASAATSITSQVFKQVAHTAVVASSTAANAVFEAASISRRAISATSDTVHEIGALLRGFSSSISGGYKDVAHNASDVSSTGTAVDQRAIFIKAVSSSIVNSLVHEASTLSIDKSSLVSGFRYEVGTLVNKASAAINATGAQTANILRRATSALSGTIYHVFGLVRNAVSTASSRVNQRAFAVVSVVSDINGALKATAFRASSAVSTALPVRTMTALALDKATSAISSGTAHVVTHLRSAISSTSAKINLQTTALSRYVSAGSAKVALQTARVSRATSALSGRAVLTGIAVITRAATSVVSGTRGISVKAVFFKTALTIAALKVVARISPARAISSGTSSGRMTTRTSSRSSIGISGSFSGLVSVVSRFVSVLSALADVAFRSLKFTKSYTVTLPLPFAPTVTLPSQAKTVVLQSQNYTVTLDGTEILF